MEVNNIYGNSSENKDDIIKIDCQKLNKHLVHVSNSTYNPSPNSLFNEKDREFQQTIDALGEASASS